MTSEWQAVPGTLSKRVRSFDLHTVWMRKISRFRRSQFSPWGRDECNTYFVSILHCNPSAYGWKTFQTLVFYSLTMSDLGQERFLIKWPVHQLSKLRFAPRVHWVLGTLILARFYQSKLVIFAYSPCFFSHDSIKLINSQFSHKYYFVTGYNQSKMTKYLHWFTLLSIFPKFRIYWVF